MNRTAQPTVWIFGTEYFLFQKENGPGFETVNADAFRYQGALKFYSELSKTAAPAVGPDTPPWEEEI